MGPLDDDDLEAGRRWKDLGPTLILDRTFPELRRRAKGSLVRQKNAANGCQRFQMTIFPSGARGWLHRSGVFSSTFGGVAEVGGDGHENLTRLDLHNIGCIVIMNLEGHSAVR